MHARYHLVRPLGAALLTALLAFSSATALADARRPVNVSSDTALPLRVLTRPGAALYQDQQSGTVINSSLPTFQSFFVYTAPEGEGRAAGGGWYEVGSDEQGNIVGWLKGVAH